MPHYTNTQLRSSLQRLPIISMCLHMYQALKLETWGSNIVHNGSTHSGHTNQMHWSHNYSRKLHTSWKIYIYFFAVNPQTHPYMNSHKNRRVEANLEFWTFGRFSINFHFLAPRFLFLQTIGRCETTYAIHSAWVVD